MRRPMSEAKAAGRTRPAGFTLVEVLVVIAIIGVLAAIMLKVTGYVNQNMGRKRTVQIIEQVRNALAEYYTTYGCYPPVSGVGREFRGTDPRAEPPDRYYRDGLTTYLFNDPEMARWSKYTEGLLSGGAPDHSNRLANFGWVFWTNNSWSINDAWDRSLQYEPTPPDYQAYRLWSLGADGANQTADDIGDKWSE